MQRIQGNAPQPVPSQAYVSERSLSSHQSSVLEGLVSRVIALTPMHRTEVWLMLKSYLGLKNESQLLSSHFPAAEKFLSKYLDSLNIRQLTHQIEDLLPSGDNRQRVYDFIQQSFNLKGLNQLNVEQLKQVLLFLKKSSSTTLKLQPWAAQLKEMNVLVSKLSTATGKSEQTIRESMRNILGVKTDGQVMPKDYPLLISWLEVQQKLSLQSNVTFRMLKKTLEQLFELHEWDSFIYHYQLRFQDTPQTILAPDQVQDVLHKAFAFKREKQRLSIKIFFQLQYNNLFMPFIDPMKVLNPNRAQATIFLAIVILVSCIFIMVAAKGIML